MNTSRHMIEELLGRYAWAHDERDFDSLADLFTEDATYEFCVHGGESLRRQGRSVIVNQIKEFKARNLEQRRHLITNFRYDEETSRRAVVRSYLTVLQITTEGVEVVTSGVYRDEVVLDEANTWRIAAKSLELAQGI